MATKGHSRVLGTYPWTPRCMAKAADEGGGRPVLRTNLSLPASRVPKVKAPFPIPGEPSTAPGGMLQARASTYPFPPPLPPLSYTPASEAEAVPFLCRFLSCHPRPAGWGLKPSIRSHPGSFPSTLLPRRTLVMPRRRRRRRRRRSRGVGERACIGGLTGTSHLSEPTARSSTAASG